MIESFLYATSVVGAYVAALYQHLIEIAVGRSLYEQIALNALSMFMLKNDWILYT